MSFSSFNTMEELISIKLKYNGRHKLCNFLDNFSIPKTVDQFSNAMPASLTLETLFVLAILFQHFFVRNITQFTKNSKISSRDNKLAPRRSPI